MKKRIVMFFAVVMAAICTQADTWTDPDTGYIWTYKVSGDTVQINNALRAAVSPSPTGTLSIPSQINGKTVKSIGDYAFRDCSGLSSVTIPGSVTSIGKYAFSGCSGLTSVTIPNSVTSIGDYAFEYCSGLTSVTIGNGVTSIGLRAFGDCSRLTSVAIPDSVTSIGSGAFYGCVGLTSVMIGNGVTSIGSFAFTRCSGLTSVTIPNSVNSIGEYAFSDCSGLEEITLPFIGSARNRFSTSGEKKLFGYIFGLSSNTGCTKTYQCYGYYYNPSLRDFTFYTERYDIPSKLRKVVITDETRLEAGAFSYCNGLTSVTIPDGVTSIEHFAFWGCHNLTSVIIPDSVKSIGKYAFYGCTGLEAVYITDLANWCGIIFKDFLHYSEVVRVGENFCEEVFNPLEYAHDLYLNGSLIRNLTIPDGVTNIGDYAFKGCSGLMSVTIPNSVTNIGKEAFSHCSGLTSVTIPDSVTSIGDWAFSGCSGLTSVTIGNGVTNIGEYAFYQCSGLTSVAIPDSVTSIGYGAFVGCNGFEAVYITDIAKWCGISFSVTEANPLYFATNLYLNGLLVRNLTIPDSVTNIGYCAFSGCSLTSVTIPNSVTNIGGYAFYQCSGLTSVTIPNSVTSIGGGAFNNCSGLTSVTIPDSVTSIGDWAFSGCSGLTSVTIGNGVTNIGEYAFYHCSGLTSVTIPDSVTSIGDWAFSGCSGLTSVTIPNSVTNIVRHAFSHCSGLTSVTIPDSVTSIGDWAFSGCSSLTSVTIGNGVTNIGKDAFSDCRSLTSVTIPDSVTSIGEDAFSDCSLTSVAIPNSVTIIGNNAFYNCYRLTSITIPNSVTIIGEGAFHYCSSLTNVTIPDSVTYIGDEAFIDCVGLTSVTIGNGVTNIGDRAFSDCRSLTSVTIGNGVTNIGDRAFSDCRSLTSVTIPDSVTNIGEEAFSGCSSLTSVAIPNSVTNIEKKAFSDCRSLTSVTIPDSVTSIGEDAFSGCSLTSVYVSIGDSYRIKSLLSREWKDVTFLEGLWVVFAANGGNVDEPRRNVTSGGAVGALPTPTRTGYKFAGWWTAAEGGSQISASTTVVGDIGCITYYAHWIQTSYVVVTLDRQGGSGGTVNVTATYEVDMPSITVPTRTGYTFDGYWTGTDGGGTQYYTASGTSAHTWDKTSATTLYAKWTGNTYTVTFDRQSGSGGTVSVTATYGSAMPSITVPTRAGYAFGGYYTSTGGNGTQYYTASGTSARTWDKTSATTLYAKWTEICVVTLDQQGGSGGTASVTVTYGSAMPTITVPTRTGYAFGGYYTSTGGSGTQYYTASGTSAHTWDKTVATTLYAKWSSTCSVTLDLQRGYSGTTNVTATYGIAMPAITVPNRYGYTFGGYWTEPNGSGTQYYTASGASARTCNMTDAVTLYAKWTANTSKVTFDKQGGSGGTSSVTATYDSAMPSITVPTRSGYKFNGYYYKYQNNEPTPAINKPYYTASGVSARNWNREGPTTLYAKWTENARCTVTLDQQGGSGGTLSITATNGVAMPPVTVPVRAGYTFGGYWTKSGGIGTRYYTESGTSARIWDRSSKTTLYAHWSEASTASYCVIDLSSGTNAVSYPVTYMAAPPSGGFNTTTYKTTKLVLRRIEPGSFKMCGKYDVTLTNPFYCGIFEVTQRQYELVTGSNPSTNKGNTRPVNVSWNSFRGNSSTYNWPDSNRVAPSSFVGKLQSRTGLNLDLPTEAQWEYACRAGTTNNYNNGGDSEGDLDLVGRYKGNESDGKGGYSTKHTAVGSYQPNRWGLYDMHGNVQEYCLDRYGDPVSGGIDPTGSSSGTNRVTRGGSYYNNANICTSSYRSNANASGKYVNNGFRLVRTLPDSYIVLTLDLKGGSLGTASATRLVAPGAAVGTLPTPTRTGYLFCGWWTAEKSGTQVAAATRVAANVTYYAHWQFMGAANETNIVFDTESSYEAESDGSFSLDLLELVGSTSTPKLTVKGLPAGLKFDAKTMTISGTVTKPGVYTVTVSATNATVNKPFTESFTITVPNLTSEMMPNLKPNNNAYGTILCGVAFEPSLVDCSPKAGWTVKAAGLPAGLKYDAKTGKITGVPTKAGTYTVTFTASKKGEKNQIATITLKVEALPDWAQGTFTGYVRRDVDADVTDASLTDYGSATMTVSAVGKISGKMSIAGTNWTFSATAFSRVSLKSENGSPDSLLVEAIAKAGKATRAVSFAVREGQSAAELVNGVAEGNVDGESVMLWRNMWKDKTTAATAKAVLAGFEGVYTVSLAPGDDYGAGYISLMVGKNGDVKVSGKLADGTAVSATSPLLYDADEGWFIYVYAAPTAYKGGAFATGIGFSKGEGVTRLSPTMGSSWRNFNPQATGAYGAGFDRVLDFTGAYYNTLDSLKAYYDAMRFGLGGVPTLEYSFKRAYFDDNGRKATVTTLGVAGAVDTFSQEGMTVSVDDKGKIVVSKATKPAQNKETKEWSYDGANDGALTLSFTQATGIFKGSYTFWYDYTSAADETTGKETLTHTSKKVSFEGIMVQGVELLQGFYLWDANGAYEDVKTGKPKTYKYKLSYPVQLVPLD